ncbi:MAG: hypothetical protein AAF802_11500, partial [Planctomycetota bacterium]
FVHGIGGGKYDQLGDEISRAFWSIDEVPSFLVTSATVRLPGHHQCDEYEIASRIRALRLRLRELEFHPERFRHEVNELPEALMEKKDELLGAIPPRGRRADWHQSLVATNQSLSAHLEPLRRATSQEIDRLRDEMPNAALWSSREHSFCLYPLQYLLEQFESMLAS